MRKVIQALVFLSLPIIRGVLDPYWISIPRMGNLDNWKWLEIEAKLFPLFIAIILATIWISWLKRRRLRKVIAGSLVVISVLYLASVVGFAGKLYGLWKDHPFGKFLLPPYSGYYELAIAEFAQPYLIHLIAGVVVGGLFGILRYMSRNRLLTSYEIGLGFILGVMFGINVLYVVLGGLILAALWAWKDKEGKVAITPFLLVASYIILLTGI